MELQPVTQAGEQASAWTLPLSPLQHLGFKVLSHLISEPGAMALSHLFFLCA